MTLTTNTNVSVDGVRQGLGGPDEDRGGGDPSREAGGFERGGWAMPHFDGETEALLIDPRWADTTVLSGDVAAAVGEMKAKPGDELQVVGSLSVVRLLLDNDLVDELTLLTYPVVVGQGACLFPDSGPDAALELVESRATTSGVIFRVYRTAGRPRYGTA